MQGIAQPARIVPFPPGISRQARDALIGRHASNQAAGPVLYPPATDNDAWRALIPAANAALMQSSDQYGVEHRPGIASQTITIAGVRVHIATPDALPPEHRNRIFLEIHGGGLVFLEGEGARRGSLREAERTGALTISIDYRNPPDHPYPAALDDCLAVYTALLETHRPGHIILGGTSGGGNLAAATVLRIRDANLPLPAALILLTPEVDLTESGDTFETLAGLDPVLRTRLTEMNALYAAGADLAHPYLSPLFADFTAGYPPTFLQSGTRDMFLSNTVRMHRALRAANIEAELHVWDGMPHAGFLVDTPEDREISQEMRRFMQAHWEASALASAP